jgi:hypothetical protein
MLAYTNDAASRSLEDFLTSTKQQDFSLADLEFDLFVCSLLHSVSSDTLKPCGALLELVAFDHQAYVVYERYGLESRVSVFQPLVILIASQPGWRGYHPSFHQ